MIRPTAPSWTVAERELKPGSSWLGWLPIVSVCLSQKKSGDSGVSFPTAADRKVMMSVLLQLKLGMPEDNQDDPGTTERGFGFSFWRVWGWGFPGQRAVEGLASLAGKRGRE